MKPDALVESSPRNWNSSRCYSTHRLLLLPVTMRRAAHLISLHGNYFLRSAEEKCLYHSTGKNMTGYRTHSLTWLIREINRFWTAALVQRVLCGQPGGCARCPPPSVPVAVCLSGGCPASCPPFAFPALYRPATLSGLPPFPLPPSLGGGPAFSVPGWCGARGAGRRRLPGGAGEAGWAGEGADSGRRGAGGTRGEVAAGEPGGLGPRLCGRWGLRAPLLSRSFGFFL